MNNSESDWKWWVTTVVALVGAIPVVFELYDRFVPSDCPSDGKVLMLSATEIDVNIVGVTTWPSYVSLAGYTEKSAVVLLKEHENDGVPLSLPVSLGEPVEVFVHSLDRRQKRIVVKLLERITSDGLEKLCVRAS